MTTLTPSQRLEAYKWALTDLLKGEGRYSFICPKLREYCRINFNFWLLSESETMRRFPEFSKRKPNVLPEGCTTVWFTDDDSGNAQREALLRECIAECEGILEKVSDQPDCDPHNDRVDRNE